MPVEPDALHRALDAVAPPNHALDPAEAIGRAVEAAAGVLGVDGVGLLLVDASSDLRYVAATDERARALERAQEAVGEGPCVEAFVLEHQVTTEDVLADARWPRLARALDGAGVRAVLGVPTRVHGLAVGTLNAYAGEAKRWDDDERAAVAAFAGVLEQQLALALAHRHASAVVEQLQHALEHRVAVERAIGWLVAREEIDPATAFQRIRALARSSRRPAAQVAAEILAAGHVPG